MTKLTRARIPKPLRSMPLTGYKCPVCRDQTTINTQTGRIPCPSCQKPKKETKR